MKLAGCSERYGRDFFCGQIYTADGWLPVAAAAVVDLEVTMSGCGSLSDSVRRIRSEKECFYGTEVATVSVEAFSFVTSCGAVRQKGLGKKSVFLLFYKIQGGLPKAGKGTRWLPLYRSKAWREERK